MEALTCIRCDVFLQSGRFMDRATPDEPEFKAERLEFKDLMAFVDTASIRKTRARSLISSVRDVVADWERYAAIAGLDAAAARKIAKIHRHELSP